jgi:hypothetical protein
MDRVFSVSERHFSEIRGVAIAITSSDDVQRHVGILHKEEFSGQILFLHLAWHLILKNEEPKPYYAWVDPSIPSLRARQVAARCREVFRANPAGIPYAFSPPNDCFDDETSAYLFGPTRHGLTCATFVLAVFMTAGIHIILPETWPSSRSGDDLWREKIITGLRTGSPPATEEHIANVEAESGLTRFRPEDVAGAAATSPIPVSFEQALPFAEEILQKLIRDGLRRPA